MPLAVIDATAITDMRTGAVTAIGAKHLARKSQPGARPHRRARHRVLERAPARPTVRLRRDPRAFAPAGEPRRLRARGSRSDLGKPVTATDDWESCVRGADIVVEASRLPAARAAAEDRVDRKGALRRALRDHERGRALAHRHHGQDGGGRLGPVPQGPAVRCAARSTSTRDRLSEGNLHAELGPDRRRPEARPRARRRDDPVLASRPEHHATSRSATRCSKRRSARSHRHAPAPTRDRELPHVRGGAGRGSRLASALHAGVRRHRA